MRILEPIAEDHELVDACPNKWIYRSSEPIIIKLAFNSQHANDQFPILVVNSWHGSTNIEIRSKIERKRSVIEISAKFHVQSGYYIYRLALKSSEGFLTYVPFLRFFVVSDKIPRSINDIKCHHPGGPSKSINGPIPNKNPVNLPKSNSDLMYSLIIDRFAVGDTEISEVVKDKFVCTASPYDRHGGNIKGLIDRLPYIKNLGVTTILINPIYLNENLLYHGYHPLHLFMVDPLIGVASDLRRLVDTAHRLSMRVIIDVVCNHMGDMVDWGSNHPGKFWYHSENLKESNFKQGWGPRIIQRREEAFSTASLLPYPVEAREISLFHGNSYSDPIRCRLFGLLEDWKTEEPFVRDLLINHVKYLIAEFDFDGVRYDAVRHIEPEFWDECIDSVREYAFSIGKTEFEQIAEHAGTTERELIPWRNTGFSGMLQFPLNNYFRKGILEESSIFRFLRYLTSFDSVIEEVGASPFDYIFLDNHDQSRILSDLQSVFGSLAPYAFQICLTSLILGRLVPIIYYGTEQEFSGALGIFWDPASNRESGHDCYVREDMFLNSECIWLFGNLNKQKYAPYCENTPSFRLISWLADIRKKHHLDDITFRDDCSSIVLFVEIPAVDKSDSLFLIVNKTRENVTGTLEMSSVVKPAKPLDLNPFISIFEFEINNDILIYSLTPLGIGAFYGRTENI